MTNITFSGLVATTPRHLVTQDGLQITSFRVASQVNRVERDGRTVAETNWITVTSFSQLAVNVAVSISKGDRVIVSGTMRVRDWDNGTVAGTSVEVDADTIGHDLAWGQSTYTRVFPDVDNTAVSATETDPTEDQSPVEQPAHSCTCRDCDLN